MERNQMDRLRWDRVVPMAGCAAFYVALLLALKF